MCHITMRYITLYGTDGSSQARVSLRMILQRITDLTEFELK